MEFTHQLISGVQQLELEISDVKIQQLFTFVELLQKWNKTYNLTAVETTQDIITKHILDSLSVSKYLKGKHIFDVGSGAGLPGIPLAITHENLKFSLLDSNAKKTRFMQQAIIQLGLKNTQIIQQRVEQYSTKETFHTLISRAYVNSNKLFIACKQLLEGLDENGRIIFMLGKQKQLETLPKSYNVLGIHHVQIPQLEAQRHIVIVEKLSV